MPLHPPGPRRERVLLFGESNSGKSTCWVDIASWIEKTKADVKVFAVDTDRSWDAMDPGNLSSVVKVYDTITYPEQKVAIKEILATATSNDILVYDMIDKLWTKSQRWFFDQSAGEDLGDLFLAYRSGSIGFGEISGDYGANWNAINKLYDDVVDVLYRFRGHIIACAPATEIREPNTAGKGGDDMKVRMLFGPYGFRPQGQKDLPHLFHTILMLQQAPSGRLYHVVKDRNREPLERGVKLSNGFTMDYLVKKAGWRP